MQPLAVYDAALSGGVPVAVRHSDGTERRYDVTRWTDPADAVDLALLGRCTGPALDLGCGPGRLTVALGARGVPALGVDLSVRAVAMARARGAVAVVRDLFAPLPGEGRWGTALLADGNIGIGGHPARLLRRVAELVRPGGRLLVEVSPDDVDRRGAVRLVTTDGTASLPFRWAEVGARALRAEATRAGWTVTDDWSDGDRRFLQLAAGGR
jgi:SAM-dependent methyltransferase